jgi:exodeoxyribonuclease-3
LQETKAERGQIPHDWPQYHEHFYSAVKKGYSGTAMLSKVKPLRYLNGFPSEIVETYGVTGDTYGDPNAEGRIIAAEFADYWVVTCYTPNSKGDLSRLKLRHEHWDEACLAYLQMLEAGRVTTAASSRPSEARGKTSSGNLANGMPRQARNDSVGKPVLYCGDMNVAHQEIDLANPKPNVGKHGFTDEERAGFQAYLDAGFVDTFRAANPDKTGAYTWWTHWANARARNVGWRIDYWLASAGIADQVKNPQIHPEVMGSDHCPVSIELV